MLPVQVSDEIEELYWQAVSRYCGPIKADWQDSLDVWYAGFTDAQHVPQAIRSLFKKHGFLVRLVSVPGLPGL